MTQLLVHNGTILTQDPARPVVPALLVEDGVITAAGAHDEVHSRAESRADRLDLGGRVVCPGFMDVHNHFLFSVLAELGVDCRTPPVGSVRQLLDELERAVQRIPAGHWVRGWGYTELNLAEGRHPTLAELDRAAPSHPLVVEHASGHMCVANSRALAAAGITNSSRNPPNGIIGRDRRGGRINGVLHECASELVDTLARNTILAADRANCVRAAHMVARRYASLGITCICDPCVPPHVDSLYQELLADAEFPIRMQALGMGVQGKFSPPVDRLDAGTDSRETGFRISGIKFFADGGEQCAVCMSKRAVVRCALRAVRNSIRYRSLVGVRLFSAPTVRLGPDGNVHSGIKFYRDDSLADLLHRTANQRLISAVHAMGNEAIDQALAAVEQARRRSTDDAVFRMEHVMMPAEDSLRKVADLSIAAVVQPRFVHDFGFPLQTTGMHREFRVLAFRDLLAEGVLMAGSSDAPVCDPAVLPAIESAVTRLTEKGDALDKDQVLSVEEALSLYTSNAARVLGLDKHHGTLAPGKIADFVVLSDDPRKVKPEQIGQIRVERTYKGGKLVYEGTHPAR